MKRHFFLPLIAAGLLAGCQPDPKEQFASAQKAFAEENYGAARADVSAALQGEPDNREMLLLLVKAQLRLHDGDGSQATVARLRRLGAKGAEIDRYDAEAALYRDLPKVALELLGEDGSPDAWRIRAAARLALDDTAGATEAFGRGMAAGQDYLLMADYARFLLKDDDLAGAARVLEGMRSLRAAALDTQMIGGQIAELQGKADAALALYRAAAAKYPTRPEPMVAIANLLDTQGKLDEAIAAAKKAGDLAPDDAAVTSLKVQLFSEKGDWDKVRSMLQSRESDLDPGSADGLTYAEALLRLGHPEQARAMFAQAVLTAPQNRYARMMLTEAMLETQDPQAAWRTVQPLVQGVLGVTPELELAERAARAAGDPAADALKARLQSPALREQMQLSGMGQGAQSRGDWQGAYAAWQKLSLLGSDAEVFKRLAYTASNLGKHAEAVAAADKAMALDPGNAEIVHMAGLVRYNGRIDMAKAVVLLRQASAALPANEAFKADVAKAEAATG